LAQCRIAYLSRNKELHGSVIDAMHEYHHLHSKIDWEKINNNIEPRIRQGLYLNAEDKSDNVFGDIFKLAIRWVQSQIEEK
jgi:hypothetical protein